jgi:hypothetical protein
MAAATRMTLDRDRRWVGSPAGSDFPAALLRFGACLGIEIQICEPHHPQHNGFVQRYHRTSQEEGLAVDRAARPLSSHSCHRGLRAALQRGAPARIKASRALSVRHEPLFPPCPPYRPCPAASIRIAGSRTAMACIWSGSSRSQRHGERGSEARLTSQLSWWAII